MQSFCCPDWNQLLRDAATLRPETKEEKLVQTQVDVSGRETTSVCWWDHHEFKGAPVSLPIHKLRDLSKVFVEGTFCSANCMISYAMTLPKAQYETSKSILKELMYIEQRKTKPKGPFALEIPPAPHFSCLRKYGGKLDIASFRNTHASKHVCFSIPDRAKTIPMGWITYKVPCIEEAFVPKPTVKKRKPLHEFGIKQSRLDRVEMRQIKRARKPKTATFAKPPPAMTKPKPSTSTTVERSLKIVRKKCT